MDSYSYSMLSTAMQCEQKFQYVYVDKLPSGQPDSADMDFGTAVHTGLYHSLKGQDGLKVFQTYWESSRNKEQKYTRNKWEDLAHIGEVFISRFDRLHKDKLKPHTMEKRLFGAMSGETPKGTQHVKIEGTPDFIGEYEGVPSILDFKTSASPYTKDKLICNPQLYLYRELAKQDLKYEATQLVYMVFVKNPEPRIQVIKMPYISSHSMEIMQALLEQAHTLQEPNLPKKNLNACLMGANRCDYFTSCHAEALDA